MPVTSPGPAAPNPSSFEVYWHDHRFQNRYCRLHNGLVRYTIDRYNPTHPLVEVWNAAWVTVGNYQIQSWSGAAYTPLLQQTFSIRSSSPDEVIWEEQRFDSASTALVRVVNRIRRGSRLIETQIIAYSGQALNGAQSVGLTNTGATAGVASADATGYVGTGGTAMAGWCFLDQTGNAAASVTGGAVYSGLAVTTAASKRISILAGVQDAQYTSLSTAALYVAHWAAVNRMRVKQRLIVSPI